MKAKKLLILNRIHDIDQIKSIIKENEIEIYSLNFSVHSVLNENKIPHVMSEELLAEDDLNKIGLNGVSVPRNFILETLGSR